MANEQMITIRGRLTADPELRWTPSGSAVANFTIAASARKFDKNTNEWKDSPTTFWRCSAWRDMAENVHESLQKGMAVVALAELESRSYEKDGQTRTVTEAKIEAIGPDLRWASARVTKTERSGGGGNFQPQQSQPQQGEGWNAPAADPWQQAQQSSPQGGGWNGPGNDEPPF